MHFNADNKVDVVQEYGPWAVELVAQTSRSRVDVAALACIVERFLADMTDLRAGGDNVRQIRMVASQEMGGSPLVEGSRGVSELV